MEKLEGKKNKLDSLCYYMWCFIILSVIGWVYEVLFELSRGSGFINRGFLHGCYLPIYGLGVLILYFSLNKLIKKKIKIGKLTLTPILVFFATLIITAAFEYFASWILEAIFNQRWWDYSWEKYHLNGRIFLKNSILIAVVATAALYWLEPALRKIYLKVKGKIVNSIAILITSIMIIDLVLVLVGYLI